MDLAYLTWQQRESIFNTNTFDDFQLAYKPSISSPITQQIVDYIKNNPQDLKRKFDLYIKTIPFPDNTIALSLLLMDLSDSYMIKTIEKIGSRANQLFPIKMSRARANVKYRDLSPEFTDPDNWKEYLNQDISKNEKVLAEIKANNEKIIDQYLKKSKLDLQIYKSDYRDQLNNFVNGFLLSKRLRFVNTNFGDVNFYIWMTIFYGIVSDNSYSKEQQRALISDFLMLFNDFYIFLSRVGLVTQANSNNVDKICQEQFENFTEDDNQDSDKSDIDEESIKNMVDDFLANIKQFDKNGDNKTTDEEFKDILDNLIELNTKRPLDTPEDIVKENKKQNAATYEIRANLKGFKPSTWRRFVIGGNSSLETLMQAILLMFNADGEHMYDLYDRKTGIRYENERNIEMSDDWLTDQSESSEEVRVSVLNEGDKLLLTYDYGDNWEFEVNVKKVFYEENQPVYPQIISGKGLGIIENIGGVGGLQDYYNTPKKELDADFIDWLGGEEVDLTEFDKDELNNALKYPPYFYDLF